MKRPDRDKLFNWAWRQAIPPHETLVLTEMAMDCTSPYGQITFCVRDFARRRRMDPKTVRKCVAKLQERGLIEDRGRHPMDDYRYMRLYQLNLDEEVGGNDTPTSGGKSRPDYKEVIHRSGESTPHLSESYPQDGGNGTPIYPQVGGNDTPRSTDIYTNTLQKLHGGGDFPQPPDEDGGNNTPTPNDDEKVVNLPPNINQGFALLVELYPRGDPGALGRAQGEFNERRRENYTAGQMLEGVKRYKAYCEHTGTPEQFVMHLKNFIGPELHFLKPWAVNAPAPGTKLSDLERTNIALRKAGFFDDDE